MNLIVLIGSGAVGKMTVGQELMKITDYRLFHNHHMIEPVIEIFGKLLSVKLDAPAPCRLDAPDLDLICYASADCLHQHLQVI